MKKEEKFRIWDATEPTVQELKEYINLISGQPPLSLMYRNDKGILVRSATVIKDEPQLEFIGVIVEKMLIYSRGFSNQDRYNPDDTLAYPSLCQQDVADWIKNNKFFDSDAHLLIAKDYRKLLNYKSDFLNSIEVLDRHNVKMPKVKYFACWFENSPTSGECHDDHDIYRLERYLQSYGDFLICSDL